MQGTAGAVLTGGASRRMGQNKALLGVDGVPMAQRVATALEGGGCDMVALIGGSIAELGPLDRPVVADLHPGQGPLGGIITALAHFAVASHVLVAACDLPMLDVATVQLLLGAARDRPDQAAIVACTDRLEPALVVWNRAAAGDLVALFDGGERAVHRALAQIDTHAVSVSAAALCNVNRLTEVPNSTRAGQ